jgi:hypothetical protein
MWANTIGGQFFLGSLAMVIMRVLDHGLEQPGYCLGQGPIKEDLKALQEITIEDCLERIPIQVSLAHFGKLLLIVAEANSCISVNFTI